MDYVRIQRTMGECEKSRLRAIKLFVFCKSGGLGSYILIFGAGRDEYPLPPPPSPPSFSAPEMGNLSCVCFAMRQSIHSSVELVSHFPWPNPFVYAIIL